MSVRLTYLRKRLPQLSEGQLKEMPQGFASYQRQLSQALHELERNELRALRELDTPPVCKVALAASQTLTANTLTTIAFDTVEVDTHGWWASNAYTPQEPGFYAASWSINFHDTAVIAGTTYATAQCGNRLVIGYGNGNGKDIDVSGTTVVECDGSTTAISVQGLMLTGTSLSVFGVVPYRCWLDVVYVGRRSIGI